MRTALPFALASLVAAAALAQATSPAATLTSSSSPAATDAGGGPAAALDGGSAVNAADAGAPTPPPLAPPKPTPPIPPGFGRVAGRVTLSGAAPLVPAISVGKDIKICGATQPDLSLQMGLAGGVREALLWSPDGPPPKVAHPHARLSIDGCRFQPYLLVTTVGTELTLVNDDALFHNVTGAGLEQFSFALLIKGHEVPLKLKRPGLLSLESKNHPFMKGYVQVLPSAAWMTSDTDGSYFLDLPPGKHKLNLWHPRLGEREETVEVAAGETTVKDFALPPR